MNIRLIQPVKKRGIVDSQFVRYIMGGMLSAIVDVVAMQLLIFAGFIYLAATTCGYIFGLIVNFLFHSQLTFSSGMSRRTLIRFIVGVAVNYLNTLVFVYIAYSYLGSALVGKIASLPVVAITGFLLGKHWIFKGNLNG